uniref:Uncharacterized protein n=1 Tax=Anguilla anguilla TaxID=7936 RepID=A0A0E9SYU0_ANGAN
MDETRDLVSNLEHTLYTLAFRQRFQRNVFIKLVQYSKLRPGSELPDESRYNNICPKKRQNEPQIFVARQ